MEQIESLIEGCRKRDRQSQEKLYKKFYPALYALCRNLLDDKHDILTAINNGMLRVFTHIDQFQPEKGKFFNWVYTTVRNSAITHLQSKASWKGDYTGIENFPDLESSYNPLDELLAMDVLVYLAELPVATRRVCSLHYLEGFSIREIAGLLGISEGTIKWHLSESRKKLQAIHSKHSQL